MTEVHNKLFHEWNKLRLSIEEALPEVEYVVLTLAEDVYCNGKRYDWMNRTKLFITAYTETEYLEVKILPAEEDFEELLKALPLYWHTKRKSRADSRKVIQDSMQKARRDLELSLDELDLNL